MSLVFGISDVIDLLERESFILSHVRLSNVAFHPTKTGRKNRKAVAVYQNSIERIANESVENAVAN